MRNKLNNPKDAIEFSINIPKRYKVNFEKVNNFNDLKNIIEVFFKGLDITINENSKHIEYIREYLIEIKK